MDNSFLKPKVAAQLVSDFRELQDNPGIEARSGVPRKEFLLRIAALGKYFGTEDLREIIAALERIADGQEIPLAIVPTGLPEIVKDYEAELALRESRANIDEIQVRATQSAQNINRFVVRYPEITNIISQAPETPAELRSAGEAQTGKPAAVDFGWLAKRDRIESLTKAVAEVAGERAEEVARILEAELSPLAAGGAHIDPGGFSSLVKQVISRTLGQEALVGIGEENTNSAARRVGETPTGQKILGEGLVGLGSITTGKQTPPPPSREEEEPTPEDKKDTRARQEAQLLLRVSYIRPFFLREVANTVVGLPFIKPWQILYALGREDYARVHPEGAVAVDLFWTHGITADSISRAIATLRAAHPDLAENNPVLQGATFLLQSLREYETGRRFFSFFLKTLRSLPDVELVEEAEGAPREGVPPLTTKRPAKVIRIVARHDGEGVFFLRAEPVHQKEEEEKEKDSDTSLFNRLRNWVRRQASRWFREILGRLGKSFKKIFSSLAKRLFGRLSSSIFNFFAGKKAVARQLIVGGQRSLFAFLRSAARQLASFAGRAATSLGRLSARGFSLAVKALGQLIVTATKALLQLAVRLAILAVRAAAAAIAAGGIPAITIIGAFVVIFAVILLVVGIQVNTAQSTLLGIGGGGPGVGPPGVSEIAIDFVPPQINPSDLTFYWPINPSNPKPNCYSGYGRRDGYFHNGIDISESGGVPVYPVADGRVYSMTKGDSVFGNVIVIGHAPGIFSLYAHLDGFSRDIGPNDPAKASVLGGKTVLGGVDSGGSSTGNHLHLGIADNPSLGEGGKFLNSNGPAAFFPCDYLNNYCSRTSPCFGNQ